MSWWTERPGSFDDAWTPEGEAELELEAASGYPEDAPDRMREVALKLGYPFPSLFDESQDVAKAYRAACTPDFYIFDQDNKLVYHGQLDSSRPNSDIPVTGEDLRRALDKVLAGKPVDPHQVPSLGCNIKWKEE